MGELGEPFTVLGVNYFAIYLFHNIDCTTFVIKSNECENAATNICRALAASASKCTSRQTGGRLENDVEVIVTWVLCLRLFVCSGSLPNSDEVPPHLPGSALCCHLVLLSFAKPTHVKMLWEL